MKEPQSGAEKDDHQRVFATREEIEAAIERLTPVEKKKLMVIATYWWKHFWLHGTEVAPDDLLQEAVLRTLKEEDGRKWPKNVVSFLKHLDRAMESVASHHRERLNAEARTKSSSRPTDSHPCSPGTAPPARVPSSDVESQLAARDEIEALRRFFDTDSQAFQVVSCRALGMDASEIQVELGMSTQEWEAVRKRVQRKLANFLKGTREGL